MAQKKQAAKKRTTKERVLKPKKETTVVKRTPSYVNLVYGAVTVIVLFLLVFFAVRTFTNHNGGEITEESVTDSQDQNEGTYEVKSGDTLWSIAESELGSGYEWKKILMENEIADPQNLEAGSKLQIPEISPIVEISPIDNPGQPQEPTKPEEPKKPVEPTILTPTGVQPQNTQPNVSQIPGTEYVVKPGDTLWDISVRAYGDGYKWVEIAQKNNLANPDLIFSGNKLLLTR